MEGQLLENLNFEAILKFQNFNRGQARQWKIFKNVERLANRMVRDLLRSSFQFQILTAIAF